MKRFKQKSQSLILMVALMFVPIYQFAQTIKAQTVSISDKNDSSAQLYLDLQSGMTADEAVAFALENNGEIQALRKETEAARSLIKQAELRPNPKLAASRAEQIGGKDNNLMVEGMLPLELGGRRAARIAVATRELEIREFALANQERLLASEVRVKFGETLANIKKLELTEEILAIVKQGYDLVVARVTEGKIALTAPVSGTITSRVINLGEIVEANKELMKVTNLSNVWVIAQVYEKDLGKMQVGSGASVTSEAYPQRLFRGRVTYIDPNVN